MEEKKTGMAELALRETSDCIVALVALVVDLAMERSIYTALRRRFIGVYWSAEPFTRDEREVSEEKRLI